jgi:prevent-host-death family protein
MTRVNISEAKAHFSSLIEKVIAGEEVIFGKAGKPVAKIQPILEELDWEEDMFVNLLREIKISPKEHGKTKITNKEIDALVYGI